MSNGDFQHESDDELLSAYIDGELSETERAAVETRLANDPDAQHLVHQLRSVSQSVQRLPLETVGRDLTEAILRRAEALKPTPAGGTTAAPMSNDARPTISIFQSRRSWMWASLAVAAGLLIMVFERGAQERDQPLAAVTNEGRPAAKRELKEQLGEVANRPAPKSAEEGEPRKSELAPLASPADAAASAPATTPHDPQMLADRPPPENIAVADNVARDKSVALNESATSKDVLSVAGATPMRSDVATDEEIRSGRIATSRAASPPPTDLKVAEGAREPAPPAPVPPPPGPVVEKRDAPLGEASGRFAGGGRGGGTGQAAPAAPGAAGQPATGFAYREAQPKGGEDRQNVPPKEALRPTVVVHLVATPESFQKKSFDKVLVSNGVVVEPQADAADQSRDAEQTTHFYKLADGNQSDRKEVAGAVVGAPASGSADFDLVLVEAPKATIASCLTDLKNDAANFVSLEVDEQLANKAKTELGGALSKQAAGDFGRFNRGTVTEHQKGMFRDRNGYDIYYDFLEPEQLQRKESASDGFGAVPKGEARAEEEKKPPQQTRGTSVQGRARRLATLGREGGQPAELATKSEPSDGSSLGRLLMRRAKAEDTAKAPDRDYSAGGPAESLHVLFVVSPQPPLEASAPAEKAAR
jgi:anti-sigma factor RsiW